MKPRNAFECVAGGSQELLDLFTLKHEWNDGGFVVPEVRRSFVDVSRQVVAEFYLFFVFLGSWHDELICWSDKLGGL